MDGDIEEIRAARLVRPAAPPNCFTVSRSSGVPGSAAAHASSTRAVRSTVAWPAPSLRARSRRLALSFLGNMGK